VFEPGSKDRNVYRYRHIAQKDCIRIARIVGEAGLERIEVQETEPIRTSVDDELGGGLSGFVPKKL